MNIFKKWLTPKQRSEWMEGLLWAEECKKDGYPHSYAWSILDCYTGISIDYQLGVSDYIHHCFLTLENKQ